MHYFYNLLVHIAWYLLRMLAPFHPKLSRFTAGRKDVFETLANALSDKDQVLWMHTASLGEFEQGLPVLERLRQDFPSHKIVLTFFSPSGYEVKKDTPAADIVTYLPMDSKKRVARFLDVVHPSLALFVKYEIWPNYLFELKRRKVPTLLISAIFERKQIFFKSYGGFMRKALSGFTHFFLQDDISRVLLESIDFQNTTVCGDTRIDRVSEILDRDNTLDFMESFTEEGPCLVAGSTWPEDEKILVSYINGHQGPLKFVLAPHNIKRQHIDLLRKSLTRKTVLYSNMDITTLKDYDLLIVDTIGLLTKIYSYADIAYVGGGFATGLHNTLEPAVFGIPVLIGPEYHGFKEAEDMVERGGLLVIREVSEFAERMKRFLEDPDYLAKIGAINTRYVIENRGATIQIAGYIRKLL